MQIINTLIIFFQLWIYSIMLHYTGHYIAALCFGKCLKFKYHKSYLFKIIPIPRIIYIMPNDISNKKKKIIAAAGFLTELGAAYLYVIYLLISHVTSNIIFINVVILHITLYCLYAEDETNDLIYIII